MLRFTKNKSYVYFQGYHDTRISMENVTKHSVFCSFLFRTWDFQRKNNG
jgi:hypothetical protein